MPTAPAPPTARPHRSSREGSPDRAEPPPLRRGFLTLADASAEYEIPIGFGLLTCDEQIGADVADMFNFLTGFARPRHYRQVLVAPAHLRDAILGEIDALRRAGVRIETRDRVFVNRDLNLAKIDWLGFDMDYTLAVYNQDALDELSVELTVARMIDRGYPRYLRNIRYDTRFPIRGRRQRGPTDPTGSRTTRRHAVVDGQAEALPMHTDLPEAEHVDGLDDHVGPVVRRLGFLRALAHPLPAISRSNVAVPVLKWIVGASGATSAKMRCVYGSTIAAWLLGSSNPSHESKSCTAETPAATWTRRNSSVTSASRPQSACQSSGSPYISALVMAKLFE